MNVTLRPLLLALVVLAAACASRSGRIKSEDEGDLVGRSAAGSAAYNQVIGEAMDDLLSSHSAAHSGTERATVAVLGFENVGIEELLDWEEQLYDIITNQVNQSGRYRTVSRRFVDRALAEGNLRQEDLFLPRYRRQFIEILEAQGNPVELLLFPRLSTGTTTSGDTSQRDYVLTLELVDVETGWDDRHSAKVRKEYER